MLGTTYNWTANFSLSRYKIVSMPYRFDWVLSVLDYFLCSSNIATCFIFIICFLFLSILLGVICSNILAVTIYTQRTKTSTIMNSQGQICFSIVSLTADLRSWSFASRCSASLSNSLSGLFGWIKYQKTDKLPPWLLSRSHPSSYLPFFCLSILRQWFPCIHTG